MSFIRQIRACTLSFILTVVGCAHTPKVTDATAADVSRQKVFYTLPKVAVTATVVAELSTFTPGPLTSELDQWAATEQALCSPADLAKPEHLCFWRLAVKRPSAANAVAACKTTPKSIPPGWWPGQISLTFAQPAVITTRAKPDATEQYAVYLGAPVFEKTALEMTFSPAGGVSSFSATSTNLIAETAESMFLGLAKRMTVSAEEKTDGDEVSTLSIIGLKELAKQLAAERQRRIAAAARPDSEAAVAAIEAEIAQLRALAEGVVTVKPFEITIEHEPCKSAPSAQNAKTPQICPGRVHEVVDDTTIWREKSSDKGDSLDSRFPCADPIKLHAVSVMTPDADSLSLANTAQEKSKIGKGLRYRVPVVANGELRVTCSLNGDGDNAKRNGRCGVGTTGYSVEYGTPLIVPQWGYVLSLPRNLGWRAGALKATLDPATGALATVSASNEASLGASLVNQSYQALLARQEAGKKDTERAALERERAVLEEQVKICNARVALGLPPGDGCPTLP